MVLNRTRCQRYDNLIIIYFKIILKMTLFDEIDVLLDKERIFKLRVLSFFGIICAFALGIPPNSKLYLLF